jgi:hypothetical protein
VATNSDVADMITGRVFGGGEQNKAYALPPGFSPKKGNIPNINNKNCNYILILLHVHPLLGNVLVNEFPRRQSVARLRNNKGGCVVYVVRAKQQLNNGVMQSASKQRNCKHVYINRSSLWGLYRRFIGDTVGRLQSVVAEYPWVKDTKPSWKGVVRIQLWSVTGRWGLYVCCSAAISGVIWSASSCVLIALPGED